MPAAPMLAAVDLDGTLLTDSGVLQAADAEAIRAWIGSGRQLAILTSRSPTGVWTAMGDAVAGCLVGSFNGALLHRRHPRWHGLEPDVLATPRRLGPDCASGLWRLLTGRGLPVLWYTASELFCNVLTAKVRREIRLTGESVTVTAACPRGDAYKILCVSDPEAPALDGVERSIPLDCSWTRSRSGNLEILDREVDKATALRTICRQLGVTPAETIAIGDGDNDVTMLRYAGISVAVANASRAALDAARLVTRSNNDNGVAHALAPYL